MRMWNSSTTVVFWIVVLSVCKVSVATARVQVENESKVDSQSPNELLQDPYSIQLEYDIANGKKSGHPDFILPSIDDPAEHIQLSSYRGTKVLLLHFASW